MLISRHGKKLDINKIKEKIIIKKFSAVTTQSSFFRRRDVLDRVYLELMKLMEMHSLDNGNNIKHWIDKVFESLNQSGKYYPAQLIISIPCARSFDDLIKYIGINNIKLLEEDFGTPDNFINSIRHRMLTESKDESPKYERHFKANGTKVGNEDFRYFLKSIALCLSGQIDIDSLDYYWDAAIIKNICTTSVNMSSKVHWSKNNFIKLIRKAISGYSGIDYTL